MTCFNDVFLSLLLCHLSWRSLHDIKRKFKTCQGKLQPFEQLILFFLFGSIGSNSFMLLVVLQLMYGRQVKYHPLGQHEIGYKKH